MQLIQDNGIKNDQIDTNNQNRDSRIDNIKQWQYKIINEPGEW